jgi:DivIVA domain-containing protein
MGVNVNKVQTRGSRSMVLLPDEITNKDFSSVLGVGYDRREVDDFLTQVAASYRGAIEKIALVATGNHSTEDFRAELELILAPARESAEEMVREAAEKTSHMHKVATERAAELEAAALERAKHIVEEAQASADRRLEESRLEVARAEQAMHQDLAERVAKFEADALAESRLEVARAEQAMHNAATQRVAELEAEALERAKRIVEEAQASADRRLEEFRLQVARAEQAMHDAATQRVAELEASGPLPRPDPALVRPTFREASQFGRPGGRRLALTLVGFGKVLLIGLLIAEILYVLIAYLR